MSLSQVLAEVGILKRAMGEQRALLNDFKHGNNDNIAIVRAELSGSRRNSDARMLQAMDAAEKSLNKAEAQLMQAMAALSRVETI